MSCQNRFADKCVETQEISGAGLVRRVSKLKVSIAPQHLRLNTSAPSRPTNKTCACWDPGNWSQVRRNQCPFFLSNELARPQVSPSGLKIHRSVKTFNRIDTPSDLTATPAAERTVSSCLLMKFAASLVGDVIGTQVAGLCVKGATRIKRQQKPCSR